MGISIGRGITIEDLLVDLAGLVPYTGATADVNLGAFNLTASNLYSQSMRLWNATLSDYGNVTYTDNFYSFRDTINTPTNIQVAGVYNNSTLVFEADNRTLLDSVGDVAINFESGILWDGATPIAEWKGHSGYLYLNNGLQVDFINTTASDAAISVSGRTLYDSVGVGRFDWENGQSFDSGGGISLDTGSRTASDGAGATAINYGVRELSDELGIISVGWEARGLYTTGGGLSWDWQNRIGRDASNFTSIHYGSRYLANGAGTDIFNWATTGIITSAARLDIILTTEQLRAGATPSIYWSATTANTTGITTFNATGGTTPSFIFSDSTTFNTAASTSNATFNKTHNSTSFLANLVISTSSPSSGSNLNLYGVNSTFTVATNAGNISNSNLFAMNNAIVKTGAFNASTLVANRSSISNATIGGSITNGILFQGAFTSENSTNSMTNAYGLKMEDYAGSASSTVTNMYGVYLGTVKGTGVTNAYGVYQAGANDTNYFNGNTGIKNASPACALDVSTFNTSLYTVRTGSFAVQPYALNNGFLGENSYFGGAGWTRISTGYESGFHFYNGQVMLHGADTGSGAFTPIYALKTTYFTGGSVGIGGNIGVTSTDFTGASMVVWGTSGNAGIGLVSAPSARLHLRATTEQLRVDYDASNYYSTTVGSTGGVTFNAAGSGAGFTFSDPVTINGNLTLGTAGNKILITEGANASVGVATLVAGTVTVNTTAVTANSRIFLTRQTTAGTLGTSVDVTAIVAGTSFTITSNGSILDTSTVGWMIIN